MTEELQNRLKSVAVIGAGGKMGRGISLVILQLMIATDLDNKRSFSKLILIDNSLENLSSLRTYLKTQMLKFAERNISRLRSWYSENEKLIDNSEVINQFLSDSELLIHTSTTVESCVDTQMVFEAIFENIELKEKVYNSLNSSCPPDVLYFSNTSSIPISEINSRSNLNNKIIGFHFYNPPAVQKLVELIKMDDTPNDLYDLSCELIGALKKIMVPSNDISGFIGNGHFIREGLKCLSLAKSLDKDLPEAIYYVNNLIAHTMVRPMGMFQLIDYVGLDVFKMICNTMGTYIEENFSCEIIDEMLAFNVRGGQFGDGSQKDGFFRYEKGKISAVFDLSKKDYVAIDAPDIPEDLQESWKSLSRSKDKNTVLAKHFETLLNSNQACAIDARILIQNYISIAEDLVSNGVTDDIKNVDSVLQNGFFHIYGPSSKLIQKFKEVK